MSTVQLDEFKTVQRALWTAGEYEALSAHIADVGERVVASTAITPGMQLLDVACGAGNVALKAAKAGAQVTGLDLTPKLLDVGRARAAAETLDVRLMEGDAEHLPFESHSFDRVVSCFGHMFAPRHKRTADEMSRVCKQGGAIVTATWSPHGTVGRLFRTAASYQPPPPDYASSPLLWGDENHVREMFASVATDFTFEQHVNWIDWESVDGWADFFTTRFGPMVTAKAMLGDRFAELRGKLIELWTDANQATDGRLRLAQEYLISIIHV